MKFHFLHLSDLHYPTNASESCGVVCNALFEDLGKQIANFPDAHLIFSGDLVRAGADLSQHSAFLGSFAARFEALGIPVGRRISVPGNHDVSQVSLKKYAALHTGSMNHISDERSFNDALPTLQDTFLGHVFSNYVKTEAAFAARTCCQSTLGGGGWDLGHGVGIFCLNTALASGGGVLADNRTLTDRGRLHVDTRSLHDWIGNTSFRVRLLVMHHPTDWLSPWAKSEIETAIGNHFQLVCSGHVHTGSSQLATRGMRGTVHCVAPPLFTDKSGPLGYAFITVDTENG